MTPDDLTPLLRSSSPGVTERSRDCPDEHSIADYVDGTLSPGRRAPFEIHLADCSHCIALVGAVAHTLAAPEAGNVAKEVLTVGGTGRQPRSDASASRAARWAVAASVVLAIGLVVSVSREPGTSGSSMQPVVPAMRSAVSTAPRILAPKAGATVPGPELTIRWSAVPTARYYVVRVVTEIGDVVSGGRTDATEWRPPNAAALQAGVDHYVHVEAYVSDGKPISSEHVSFRIAK